MSSIKAACNAGAARLNAPGTVLAGPACGTRSPAHSRLQAEQSIRIRLLTTIKAQEQQINSIASTPGTLLFNPDDPDETSVDSASSSAPITGNAFTHGATPISQPVSTPSTRGGLNVDGLSPSSSAPTERASGPAFELRVRSLLQQRRSDGALDPPPGRPQPKSLLQLPAASHGLSQFLQNAPIPDLPTQAESHHLLSLFLTWLGVNQHFFDSRAFADTMTSLFRSEASRRETMNSVWFIEYLLVMAMGKLMDFDTEVDTPHGLDYFAEAMRLMPPMHLISDHGIIGVEILSLVALNLRWRDRKYEAYFHIGIAVRLALTLGCAQPYDEQDCLPSERAHRIRLWWTVFMLDRRFSADLGLPVAADDRQLSTELPQDAPGFPSPQAIIINVRIARTTGDIMTSLYGNTCLTQPDLVHKVQNILKSLFETGHSIPPEYSIDLTRPFPCVTRTGGSLYLMLFQAIILCTRPILLQRVKEKVTAASTHTALDVTPPVIDRLCMLSKESAIKTIRILYALDKKRQIARFGFFDLDATFSAALTLVMFGFLDGVSDIANMPPELDQAVDVLLHLSRAGNKAAEQRLRDIRQFCSFIWPDLPVSEEAPSGANLEKQYTREERIRGSSSAVPDPGIEVDRTATGYGDLQDAMDRTSQADEVVMSDIVDFEKGNNFLDLNMEADGIYSSFNDPTLPLTGVDDLDWAEIEKVFTGRLA
ncbi:uncharacterized protein E0L32_008908 [Thyridium curvatum]|uniref:Xylanolytic transcriptional activator regulatory domain-containing protein n=1 Tax=Thyridium curvatum TaxID=1093900 RepID=A0A507AT60_9PEZI|nr:uncharacterized protein E0L32_008908 [Thyridium curvatum]TPX09886.1 hypothetical protein E0L32_008908 [Thyridium curvatum]